MTAAVAGLRERPPETSDLRSWLKSAWGLSVESVAVVDPGGAFRDGTWLVLATLPRNATHDLYVVRGRVAPSGRPIHLSTPINLTLSEWADDTDLQVQGTRAATLVRQVDTGKVVEVQVRDLGGERADVTGIATWSRQERMKNAVLNWAETGSFAGMDLQVYRIDPPADTVEVTLAPDGTTRIEAGKGVEVELIEPEPKERLMMLHWVANVGRRLRGLGPAVELLKEFYFKANQVVEAARDTLVTEAPEEAAVEAPEVVEEALRKARLQTARSARAWPPAPLAVVLNDRREGEGIWQEVSEERASRNPNAPPAFYQTFIRIDPERPRKRVFVSIWDPAQVSLRFQTGRAEPISTTGLRGMGRIPRDPALLDRVVAAFNGGFQTYHGKYGVYVERRLYVPPLAGIATVVATADGRTGFGTWEAGRQIGDEILDLRQNLPPVIEDGVINPYGILKWGASQDVAGAVGAFTVRSGVCRVRDGYAAYFWCEFCDAPGLGRAMKLARCDYGVHLDMNSGHSGFEFYHRLEASERSRYPQKNLGYVEKTGQWFYATRMVPRMSHMRFPRYLKTDYRDFFYLVRRPVMPGPGRWRTDGLGPNTSYPPALALSQETPGVVELDPTRFRALVVPAGGPAPAPTDEDHARLSAAIPLVGATLHLPGAPPPTGDALVLAVSPAGALSAVRPGDAEKTAVRVAIPGIEVRDGGFLVFRAGTPTALQLRDGVLFEGPIDGGEGTQVKTLATAVPRLLISTVPPVPQAFRF